MSDLDADLYGDLYGNDEGDFTNELQESQKEEEAAQNEETPAPAPAVTKTSTPRPADSTTVANGTAHSHPSASQPAQPQTASVSSTAPIPATSYEPQVAQQIPTYEQPSPPDFRESMIPHGDSAGYQNIPVPERTIRPSEMKDEGKMFIGGLNWDTTDDSLRNYFTQFGKVDACTIMRDAAGRSRCFAFLTFDDPASVNAVMVREHFLDGKIIDPKRAIPRQEHQRATKLFIGGLAGSVTSESMREFFSQFGKVIDSTVMLDRETGRSKGFGFVSFEDTNVQPFLGFGNLEIDGKLIDVKLAQPRYQRDGFSEREGGSDYGGAAPVTTPGRGAGGFGGAQNAFSNVAGPTGAPTTGTTPFDPQALAALYTRMFQMTGAGQMNPAMMGGSMGMMGGPGGFGGPQMGRGMMGPQMGGMGGMGMGGGQMGGQGMGGQGMGGQGMGGGMARGGGGMMTGPAAMNPNIPRGPRGGPGGMGAAGVGPQRAGQRGQHNYHPYAR